MQDELSEDNFNMSKQPIILREEPHHASGFSSFGAPPQYYGSRDEEFSECESLVNSHNGGTMGHQGSMSHHGNHGMNMGGMAMGGTLPAHHTPYSRPPPVALEFSDSLARSRHRPAPQYRRQNFHPWSQTRIQTSSLTSGTSQQHQTHQEYHRPKRRRPNLVFERFKFNPWSRSELDFHLKLEYCHCTHWWGDNCYLNQRLVSPQNQPCNQWLMRPYESDASKWPI